MRRFTTVRRLTGVIALAALGLVAPAAQAQQVSASVGVNNPTSSPFTTTITFTQTSFTSASRPLELASLFTGTFSTLSPGTSVQGSSVLMETFADANNQVFGTGFTGGSFLFTAPNAPSASYSNSQIVGGFNPPPGDPFSLTLRFTVTVGAFSSFSGTGSVAAQPASVSAVPEPSEWAGMGILATGLGGLVVRARRKRA